MQLDSLAQFLNARDLLALSQVDAQMRARVWAILPTVIATRYPGRTRAGAHDTPKIRKELPDWKFVLLLEDHNNRASCVNVSLTRNMLLRGDICLFSYDQHHSHDVKVSCGEHYYWTGFEFAPLEMISNMECIPEEFILSGEFPLNYYATLWYAPRFAFHIDTRRDQILATLETNVCSEALMYKFHFVESSREYWFKIRSMEIDFRRRKSIALIVVSCAKLHGKVIWFLWHGFERNIYM